MISERVPETLPISSLNALEYCQRRFYYQFVQSDMLINEFVLEGTLVHQRAHQPGRQTTAEGEMQTTRVYLCSEGLLIPVEYKHGHQGEWLNDHIQLCAQALCLEDMQPEKSPLPYGYIYYIGSRRRVRVDFNEELSTKKQADIYRAFQVD